MTTRHLVPTLRMSAATAPLPIFCTFMIHTGTTSPFTRPLIHASFRILELRVARMQDTFCQSCLHHTEGSAGLF